MNALKKNWFSNGLCALIFVFIFLFIINQIFLDFNFGLHFSSQITLSSDVLSIPDFVQNLLWQHGTLKDWSMPGVTYLVPDILLNSVIFLFSNNIMLNFAIYAILQIILYVLLLTLLLKASVDEPRAYRIGLLSALISLIALSKGYFHEELLNTLLFSNFHFGQFIMSLLTVYLLLLYLQQGRLYLLICLFLLSIVTIISDLIFIASFCLPAALSILMYTIMGKLSWKKGILLSSYFLLITIVGKALFDHLTFLPYVDTFGGIYFKLQQNIYHFNNVLLHLWIHVSAIYMMSPWIALLWVLFIPLAISSLYVMHRYSNNSKLVHDSQFTLIFILAVILVELFTALFMDSWYNTPNMYATPELGGAGFRHVQNLILMPLFIGLPIVVYQHLPFIKKCLANTIMFSGLLGSLLLFYVHTDHSIQLAKTFNYYPEPLQCLDNTVKKYQLHAGIATYWNFRPFMLLSHSKVPIVEVKSKQVHISHWMNTLQFYRHHDFDFALLSSLRSKDIKMGKGLIHQYGEPTHIVQCSYPFYIYVYKNPAFAHLFKHVDKFRIINHQRVI